MIQLTRLFTPSSMTKPTLVLLALSAVATLVHAEDETLEAIETQTASVLASSEYANKRCPNLETDESELQDLLTRINKTKDDLRSHESYQEQRTVLQSVEKQSGRVMVCMVLSGAHGGYARDVINEK